LEEIQKAALMITERGKSGRLKKGRPKLYNYESERQGKSGEERRGRERERERNRRSRYRQKPLSPLQPSSKFQDREIGASSRRG
jgi:hypothetical protein